MTTKVLDVLIVGGSSQIGSRLITSKKFQKFNLISTSRTKSVGNIFFDLSNPDYSQIAKLSVDIGIILAGITNITDCQLNPEYSNLVNVKNTINLIERLVDSGVFVVYLSSAAVYDGVYKNIGETQNVAPNTIYGAQKCSVESAIINTPKLRDQVAILRPTKVISNDNHFFSRGLIALKNQECIQIFDDYYFSPITMDYALSALLQLITLKIPGIFHISSDEDISYFDFFKRVAIELSVDPGFVLPISKLSSGKILPYQAKFSRLSMPRTTKMLSIYPQRIEDVIRDFVYEF